MQQNRTPPAGPSAVGARHVKEVRKGIRGVQPCCGLRVIPRGGRESGSLGACTAGPTHPTSAAAALGLGCPACQFTQFTVPSVRTVNRKRAADAHASSHMQVQGGPLHGRPPPQNPASSLPPCQLKPSLGCLTLHIKSGTTNLCPVQLCNQHRRRIHMGGHPWGTNTAAETLLTLCHGLPSFFCSSLAL